jgi:outer membrane lipopolysaccharide assembly protein LptE/RlpB
MRTRLALASLTLLALTLTGCARGFWITNNTDQPYELTATDHTTGDRTTVTLKPGETRAFGGGPIKMGGLSISPR